MVNSKIKKIGIVLLVFLLFFLAVGFLPLMDMLTFYLVTAAILALQIALALAILKIAWSLIMMVFNRRTLPKMPQKLKKILGKNSI
ncbi:hypothetical protein NFX11_000083 [Enterococcus faecalis]|uniref:hypothetical protein n=1 Tax=Enterococcus faecalis TaxID=1351 RepID=UPI0003A3263D|nr:hypothetical protein [Enterococcus faecalis]EGO5850665.1 hypothetical protein [Enterococcus faecalis]EJI7258985.1 hypothetical protein [Enterococcus faecalis]NSM73096.1 hypothetical protein [Enterococcus faecalis]